MPNPWLAYVSWCGRSSVALMEITGKHRCSKGTDHGDKNESSIKPAVPAHPLGGGKESTKQAFDNITWPMGLWAG